jgi:hypothetical protein
MMRSVCFPGCSVLIPKHPKEWTPNRRFMETMVLADLNSMGFDQSARTHLSLKAILILAVGRVKNRLKPGHRTISDVSSGGSKATVAISRSLPGRRCVPACGAAFAAHKVALWLTSSCKSAAITLRIRTLCGQARRARSFIR